MSPKLLTSVRVSSETKRQLEELAVEMDAPQSWVVALAIEKIYQERKYKKLSAWLANVLRNNGFDSAAGDNFTVTVCPDGSLSISQKAEGVISFDLADDGQIDGAQKGVKDESVVVRRG